MRGQVIGQTGWTVNHIDYVNASGCCTSSCTHWALWRLSCQPHSER